MRESVCCVPQGGMRAGGVLHVTVGSCIFHLLEELSLSPSPSSLSPFPLSFSLSPLLGIPSVACSSSPRASLQLMAAGALSILSCPIRNEVK